MNNYIITNSGSSRFISLEASGFVLNSAIENLSFIREGNNLAITSQNGDAQTVINFFVSETDSLPALRLSDGTVVDSHDFLEAQNPDMDLSTAAGPQNASSSSGSSEYSDGSGELVEGLDGLEMLAPMQREEQSPPVRSPLQDRGVMDEGRLMDSFSGPWQPVDPVNPFNPAGPVGPTSPVDPTGPVGPTDPVEPTVPVNPGGSVAYHTRFVVSHTTGDSFAIDAYDELGNKITDASRVTIGSFFSPYFNTPVVDVTGKIILSLTSEGKNLIDSGLAFDELLTITVDNKDYAMQLLGNGSTSDYDSSSTESTNALPGELFAEYYSSDGGRSIDEAGITLGGTKYNQVSITSESSGRWDYAAHNTNIELQGESGDISISSISDMGAYALITSADGSKTSVVQGGNNSSVTISAETTAVSSAFAVYSYGAAGGAKVDVSGDDITLGAKSIERTAAGIWAENDSEVTVRAEENLVLTASSTGGQINYLTAGAFIKDGATANLSGVNITASINSYKGSGADGATMSVGFRVVARSVLNITTAPDGKLSVETYQEVSPYDSPYTGVSWTGGRAAGFTSVGLSASGNADQYNNGPRGTLDITTGDMDISSRVDMHSNKGTAVAVYGGYGGNVKITGEDLGNEMKITSEAPSWAAGIFSTNHGTTTLSTGGGNDTFTITTHTHNGAVSAAVTAQAGGKSILQGGAGLDVLNIEASFTGTSNGNGTDFMQGAKEGAFGMISAWGGASNTVSGFEEVNILADASGSTNGNAYGMMTVDAYGYGPKNIIESDGGGAIKVTITALAGTLGNAYSMIAHAGGENIIRGESHAGDTVGDTITLNGDMHVWGGRNHIITGEGDDTVTINGDLSGTPQYGMHFITMGGGDDILRINGDITSQTDIRLGTGNDTFHLNGSILPTCAFNAGEGYDTLILTAPDYDSFIQSYGNWLTAQFKNINVEAIHVEFSNASEIDMHGLQSFFSANSDFDNADITYSYGDTIHLANLSNETDTSSFNLADILDRFSAEGGYRVLDLTGGKANTVTIDNQIDESLNGLHVNGSPDDTVVLNGNWTQHGAADGYTSYTNDDLTVHIQDDLLVNLIINNC